MSCFPLPYDLPNVMKLRVHDVKRNFLKKAEILAKNRLLIIVGNYGSGKTEIAVNLAILLKQSGKFIQIADLDIVNPYFRCREAKKLMEDNGIRVVVPPPSQTWADLPIVVPEIKGMLNPAEDQLSIFDVGGDDAGAKLLSSFKESLGNSPYELWQVINSRRPFTDTVEGCLNMQASIEQASRLKVTGLIVNTHLMDETTPAVIVEGYELAQKVAGKSGLPIVFVGIMEEFIESEEIKQIQAPLLPLVRRMLPPWLRPQGNSADSDEWARPVPIGKP
ncbi:MAG: cobalamin biosynthesis protein CbiA [Deltaproteobacteria bacterium]|nr:cobalamin biosynthesis protein CbiA [Deltaproteobacteria bacterium]